MRSYVTDRRVFEYWSEGDWIAADRLMGLVGALFRNEPCADGGDGPCTVDHIGPLSLGFLHRPEFRLLSRAANSAKNNRMTLWDVNYLKTLNRNGIEVISWYAKPLWDLRKDSVLDEETSLRISKLLRDNQRAAMHILTKLLEFGALTFLASLLELNYAERNVEFANLRIDNYITKYDGIQFYPRITKYACEQKARRIRIGFNSLITYRAKNNRHYFNISETQINKSLAETKTVLSKVPKNILELDSLLRNLLRTTQNDSEYVLRRVSNENSRIKSL